MNWHPIRTILTAAFFLAALFSLTFADERRVTLDGTYEIFTVVGDEQLWAAEDSDRFISIRPADPENYTVFVFEPLDDGSHRIRVEKSDRYWHDDGLGDKMVSTRHQSNDDFTHFFVEETSDGYHILVSKGSNVALHLDPDNDKYLRSSGHVVRSYTLFQIRRPKPFVDNCVNVRCDDPDTTHRITVANNQGGYIANVELTVYFSGGNILPSVWTIDDLEGVAKPSWSESAQNVTGVDYKIRCRTVVQFDEKDCGDGHISVSKIHENISISLSGSFASPKVTALAE